MKMTLRPVQLVVRLAALGLSMVLAILLFGRVAFAAGQPPVTVKVPTQAAASTAPTVNARASAAVSVTAPVSASINISSSNKSKASVQAGNISVSVGVSAPNSKGATVNPVVSVHGRSGNAVVSTTASAPTQASITSPSNTSRPGSGTVAVVAPTNARASTSPAIASQATVGKANVSNTTTAPANAAASTCPLVGVGVHGYGCGNNGSATAVAFAPSKASASGVPSTTTHAAIGNAAVNNSTTAPTNASAATCPLVGVGVRGYGCSKNGSATGVIFAPTSGNVSSTPAANTSARAGNTSVNNSTTAPTNASAATCPLVGVGVRGYGCGKNGSATGVIFAPTTGSISTSPVSNTTLVSGNTTSSNSTSLPTNAGITTCPLIGIGVRGYGCGNPGSATAVVFAPTSGTVNTNPTTGTQLSTAGATAGGTASVPTGVGVTTCPLIGIGESGYGCGGPGNPSSSGGGSDGGANSGSTGGSTGGTIGGSTGGQITASRAPSTTALTTQLAQQRSVLLSAPNNAAAQKSGANAPAAGRVSAHNMNGLAKGVKNAPRNTSAMSGRPAATRIHAGRAPVQRSPAASMTRGPAASSGPGLARLPRTGAGSPVPPAFPVGLVLIALFLMAIGVFTRRRDDDVVVRR